MALKSITVTLSSIGVSAGPFNIADNILGVVAMNVSRASLLAGYTLNVDSSATVVNVISVGACTNSISINLATPLPTATPTITPSPTITPTPTQAPIYFDSNYAGSSNVCGQGGRSWSRLIAPSGTTVEITVTAVQFVTSISSTSACVSGGLFETTLPASTPAIGTELKAVTSTVLLADVPRYLESIDTYNLTMPAAGYKDFLIVYRTKNIANNFSNGQFSALVTKVNGVSVSNGGKLSTAYNCSDTGTC